MVLAVIVQNILLLYCYSCCQLVQVPFAKAFVAIPLSAYNDNIRLQYSTYPAQSIPSSLVSSTSSSRLFGHTIHTKDHDNNMKEINEARLQFEKLIGPLQFDNYEDQQQQQQNQFCDKDHTEEKKNSNKKIKPHLLTNAGRKRRELEIRLLQSLGHTNNDMEDNDVIDELMSLWVHECPCKIVSVDTIEFLSSPSGSCTLIEAEMILRTILNDTASTELWPEPAARLAFVLYQQQRYEECEYYVQSVLKVKPWHFEMIQLQVILELSYHHNLPNAIRVTRTGLPPLSRPKQRMKWVHNTVQMAQLQLQVLEQYTADVHASSFNENEMDQFLLQQQQHIDHTMQLTVSNSIIGTTTAASTVWQ